ncbi:hypothetical protein DFH09DRAFT_1364274 [Mycena vulgaris]|nr:hypothetical protein DFH09DRAFT_1364274 [Mycena vulgaris]
MAEELSVPPSLPFELERSIFETAALSRPLSVPSLMRVAWRVKHWVEPLLYRTLSICADGSTLGIPSCSMEIFTHIADTKSASFMHSSVRNLMLHLVSLDQCKTALAACSGVENLWIMLTGTPDPASCIAVGSMSQLRHLHCDFEELCWLGITFAHPSFSHITHLELFHRLNDDEWAGLTGLAHLTHLSFNAYGVLQAFGVHPLCVQISACFDPRFVIIPIITTHTEDWKRGALTGVDYWARADAFIAKRISGEIDRRTFFLPTDSEDS